MKIAFLDPRGFRNRPGQGGMSDTIWNMARCLADMGDEVYVLGPYSTDKYPHDGVNVKILKVPDWSFRNIVTQLYMLTRAWRQVQEIPDIQIVHVRDYLASGVFGALSRRTPIVLTVPGNVYQREALGIRYFDAPTRLVFKMAARVSAKRCKHVIATSQDMRDWWIYIGTSPLRIATIPLGVDTGLFRAVPAARELLGWEQERKIVLYVGRLAAGIKQLPLLLQAMRLVSSQLANVELHLVGDGQDRQYLVDLTSEYGLSDVVSFHGWVDSEHLPMYYSAADLTILTSAIESFGRTMLESMACGTPFLGPNVGGMADHLTDGKTGYVARLNNDEQLAQQILYILQHDGEATAVANEAKKYVEHYLAWPLIVNQMRNEVYSRLS
jgi:glycosyltransferase involved in cell wall biosynthesis